MMFFLVIFAPMTIFDPSTVTIRASLPSVEELLGLAPNPIIITDSNLAHHYRDFLESFSVIVVPPGEGSKSFARVEELCTELMELGADRHSFLVGFGGGMVTDLTGFVASIYMRGVDFGFISTSLLGQLDASVGGKNGINLHDYKNMIGCFNHPKWVVCPTECFKTLPERELKSGYAEAVKCALLRDSSMLELFNNPVENILEIVRRTVAIKSDIVTIDPTEKGDRKLLNLGHTFAHAIEKCFPKQYLHGEAVAIGLVMMAKLSCEYAGLDRAKSEQIEQLIGELGLPVSVDMSNEDMAVAMRADKKKQGQWIEFILISDFEKPEIKPVKAGKSDLMNFLLSLHS